MALRTIVLDGDPILLKKSREVTKFDDRLAILIDDMVETMRHANGVGLAAVQVGVLRRVLVVEVDDQLIEIVNPELTITSDEIQCGMEGCLSFPEEQAVVERPCKVRAVGKDRHGNPVEYEAEGYLARAFCHETDHLNGITFLDVSLSEEEAEKWLEQQLAEDEEDFEEDLEEFGEKLEEEFEELAEEFLSESDEK